MDGKERAGAFCERNSKSVSENSFTSVLYRFCTAPIQSIEVVPEPIHEALSVQWLLFAAESMVKLPCGMPITALDTMLMKMDGMTKRRKIAPKGERGCAVGIVYENVISNLRAAMRGLPCLYRDCGWM